jgi:hypothetical protein
MRLIRSNCRIQFTAADIDFILEVLQPGVQTKECVEGLLADEDTRDLLLDDEQLFRAVLECRGCLRVSTHLYFYILVRQVFRQAGLADRRVADYVAEVLAEFSRTKHTQLRLRGQETALTYFCDLLAALQTVDDTTRFYIQAHVGNSSLFLSGIFPEHIRYRADYRGAPGLKYYEDLGRSNFRAASDHRLAQQYDLAEVYFTLAERFQDTRLALNDLGERLVCLNDADCARVLHWLGDPS